MILVLAAASSLLLCGGPEPNAPPPMNQMIQQRAQIQRIDEIDRMVRSLQTTVYEQEKKNEAQRFKADAAR